MIGKLRTAWVLLLLALVAGPAFALGLGQIEVKSQRDQPLLAEIPIISSDPAELENLQARLASPETFARIGLEPPQGVVSGLQFTIALDAQGRPVIRVTSAVPVQQPLLTFLIEVDWGEGRLVREYSALLDAPRTVSAPAQPPIQAPTVVPPNTIVREPEAPVAATPVAPPEPVPEPTPDAPSAPAPAQPLETASPSTDIASTPPPPAATLAPPPAPATAPVAQAGIDGEYAVKRGDTLSEIAGGIVGSGYTLDQTMLALLRTNPEAFIGGNINLVKQGAVLRVPTSGELASLGADEAAVMVRDQIAQWRQARQPAPQPAALAGDGEAAPARAASTNNAPRVADARLEIVPPSSNSGRRAGTRSGIDAGGEGDMLRQDLQQTKETLAARDSEVEELKARVADLEKLQQQQQQLITLKDSELAAAQQRLAVSNQQAAAAPATSASTQAPASADSGNAMVWVWGGLALLALGLLAWWLSQRRRAPVGTARTFNTAAMAASIPSTVGKPVFDKPSADVEAPVKPTFVDAAPKAAPEPVPAPAPNPAPAWNANAAVMPTWHADASATTKAMDAATPVESAPPAGQERIELARAYIDLGDVDTARSLLREVVDNGDSVARGEASRLLRELA